MTRKRKDGISPARPSSLASPSSLALYVRRAHPSSPALTKKHVGRLLERLRQISKKKLRKSRRKSRKIKRRDGSPRKSSPRKSSPRKELLLIPFRSRFRSPSRSPSPLSPLHALKELQRKSGVDPFHAFVDKLIGNTKEKRKNKRKK